jgi:DNA repair protein RadC
MNIYEASVVYRAVGTHPDRSPLECPEKIAAYIRDAFTPRPMQEQIWVVALNRKFKPLGRFLAFVGTLSSCPGSVREILQFALLSHAAAIVISHNHPSGDPSPSSADIKFTRQLTEAAKLMGIEFLDHVIIGDEVQYYSFRHAGLMP